MTLKTAHPSSVWRQLGQFNQGGSYVLPRELTQKAGNWYQLSAECSAGTGSLGPNSLPREPLHVAAWASTKDWREVIESHNYLGGENPEDVAQQCGYILHATELCAEEW